MNIHVGFVTGDNRSTLRRTCLSTKFPTTNAEMNEDFAFLYVTISEVNLHVLNYSKYLTQEHFAFSCNCLSMAHPTSGSLGSVYKVISRHIFYVKEL